MKTKKIKCSFCPNELEVLMDSEYLDRNISYGGAVNWITCGFGSNFDGEQLLIAICDKCLKKADILDRKKYLFTEKKED